jgi:hypothetical protein
VQVGDLVKLRGLAGIIGPSCCGVVVRMGELSITIAWLNGHESYEPESILEIVNENR